MGIASGLVGLVAAPVAGAAKGGVVGFAGGLVAGGCAAVRGACLPSTRSGGVQLDGSLAVLVRVPVVLVVRVRAVTRL